MANNIGRFGRQYDRVDLDFDFFEATIRVNPSCSTAALIEFLDAASSVDQQDEIVGAQLIMRTMREVVHPDDFDRFWTIAKRERQDPQTDIMPIAQQVIEAASGFPTGQPSASSAGPSSTSSKSAAGSPSPAVPAGRSTADQALAMLRGRPDLQEFVVMEEEAQRARGNGRVAATG